MLRLIMLSVFLAVTAPAAAQVREIPVQDFFRRPLLSGFQLSPSGQYLAAVVPVGSEQRRNLAVVDLRSRSARAVTNIQHADVSRYLWATDDRLLFLMDDDGDESYGIFAVNRDGTEPKTLIEPARTQVEDGAFVVRSATVINRLPRDPDRVLVTVPRMSGGRLVQDVKTLNIHSGEQTVVERNPGDVGAWITDSDGDVVAASQIDGLITRTLYKASPAADWRTLWASRLGDPSITPVWVSNDRRRMYVSSYLTQNGEARDRAAVYRADPADGTLGELVYEDPAVDVGGVVSSPVGDDVVGVAYTDAAPAVHFVDSDWQAIQASLQEAFPGKVITLTSRSRDEQMMVFKIWSSSDPGTYYLFDRARRRLEELAATSGWLKRRELASMKSVTIPARDGLPLPAYLTLPVGSDGRNLPLVLDVHGGPRSRDVYSYDPVVQLMANRGYAVLQVNFRGSTGYGRAFDQAGWQQWGLKMQDDLTDAVHWAVEQGIADAGRVCIFGASYGGYAALAGLAFTPDLYQCGISYAGVTDIPLLFATAPASWRLAEDMMKAEIGDPQADRQALEDRSPANHAADIKAPVLMVYGERDPRVVLQHALKMEAALKHYDKDYELIVKKDEGHGFRKLQNQVEFGTRLIKFLDANIGD